MAKKKKKVVRSKSSKPAKAAKKKLVEKKVTKKVVSKDVESGTFRKKDVGWNTTKVLIFKALKSLKAIDTNSAVSASAVAEKASVSAQDVRHYSYHAQSADLIHVVKVEGLRGYGFYITKKGAKVDLTSVIT